MMSRYFIGLFRIDTADSAQPKRCSMVTKPFSSQEGIVWAGDYGITVCLVSFPDLPDFVLWFVFSIVHGSGRAAKDGEDMGTPIM